VGAADGAGPEITAGARRPATLAFAVGRSSTSTRPMAAS
jgi:hypothetical protein